MHRLRCLLAATLMLGCAPVAPPTPNPSGSRGFVIKVTTGQRESVSVDWAILPDESWPLEGRRDRTPFELDLPQGRVAALFRPTAAGRLLEVTVYQRDRDGSLVPLARSGTLPIAVVVREPRDTLPRILGPAATDAVGGGP